MDQQQDPLLNRDDALKAENTFLKLKLGLEHGMHMTELSSLSPDIENQWLKSVYAFEQQFKDAKRTKLYDYLGKPAFRKWDSLSPEEFASERKRLELIMEQNNVQLDCICQYDDALIYRFITEELFEREMDDMRIPGMTLHYTYEEFHPNHDYDLRRDVDDFIHAVFAREWSDDYDGIRLSRKVSFGNREFDREGIAPIIKAFQDAHEPFEVEKLDITAVDILPDLSKASVRATLSVSGKMKSGDDVRYKGNCNFAFVRDDDYWFISAFDIPAFGGGQL